MNSIRIVFLLVASASLAACASNAPPIPYPVFTQASDIPDSFLATLPGTRAKIFNADAYTRRSSLLLQLPADFRFGTGGEPDKSLEIYVLKGEIELGEFTLGEGGYAFLPSGSMGVSMTSTEGALLLYFLDKVQPGAVIQTPIISNSKLLKWTSAPDSVDDFGMSVKELRNDPGSGARTWLLRIDPGAAQEWQSASVAEEGYLVSGHYRHAECSGGFSVPGEYLEGGYYLRPANAINGGPEAEALTASVWLVRMPEKATFLRGLSCAVTGE